MQDVEQNIKSASDEGLSLLIGYSYWSFGLGFGPLIPIVAAWVFRRNAFLCKQLLQSALLQSLFWSISFALFLGFLLNSFYSVFPLDKLSFVLIQGTLNSFACIILFIISVIVWTQKSIEIPLFQRLSESIVKFCEIKKIKKALALNLLWPGLGQLYLGQGWLGWILFACQLVSLFSLLHLWLAYTHCSIAKDLLGIFGFYWRVGDQAFAEEFATLKNIFIFIALTVLNYFLAIFSLKFKLPQRRILGSFSASYLMHFAFFWILLLMPYIFTKSLTKEAIKKRAEEIQKKLQQEKLNEKQIPSSSTEKEIKFDLELPEQVEGLNEFQTKPFSESTKPTNKPIPTIGFGSREEPLPPRREYNKKQSRKTKSYSEYLTAKVREGNKDKLIWEKAPYPYSSIMQYTISADGYISDIKVVQPSNNLQIDSMVVSVLESMSPLKKPPNGKILKITELFWNTGGQMDLDTKMKLSLATYPDGRVIEEVN